MNTATVHPTLGVVQAYGMVALRSVGVLRCELPFVARFCPRGGGGGRPQ